VNYLHLQWLQEHRRLLAELRRDLMHVIDRVDQLVPRPKSALRVAPT
jgi:hypothetical protein